MKNTKTVAVPTVLTDAKTIEAIAYNIAAMVQIQPSMSEPADVSLLLPSSDLLLMDTKTAAVSTVLSDRLEAIANNIAATYNIAATAQIQPSMSEPADRLEAIIHNIAATAQIQPSSMSEFADGADPAPSAARRPGPSSPSVRGRVRRRKLG